MPDPHRTSREFEELWSRPAYAGLFEKLNRFGKPGASPVTPRSLADESAADLQRYHPLLDPVEILEFRGPAEFYRVHDGGARLDSARSLGRSWIERAVLQTIWKGTDRFQSGNRRGQFMEFLRSANFVLPEWNDMSAMVCMSVPVGCSVVVARGRGSWRAMRTPPGKSRPHGQAGIHTVDDVLREGMMPIPGTVQCFIPLSSDMWIQPVDSSSLKWPFYT